MRHDEDPRLEHQLVRGDPDCGAHLAIRSLFGLADTPSAEDATQGHPVLFVEVLHVGGGSFAHVLSFRRGNRRQT
jgi:hypothetical protein